MKVLITDAKYPDVEDLERPILKEAGFDVELPQEPPPSDHPLLQHPRVLLSPHSAFYSLEAEEDLRRRTILNIIAWSQTGRPPNVLVEGGACDVSGRVSR